MKYVGRELWPGLIEKAFAKFCGSYNALDGGWAVWGWAVLTGDHVFRLSFGEKSQKWERKDVEAKRVKGETSAAFYSTKEAYDKNGTEAATRSSCRLRIAPLLSLGVQASLSTSSLWPPPSGLLPLHLLPLAWSLSLGRSRLAETWNMLLNYVGDKSLVAASGGKEMGRNIAAGDANAGGLNGEQLNDAAGLVGTHAYSILDAKELGLIPGLSFGGGLLGQTRLIRLRNPWGSYEWKGAWSDGSKEWDENPLVKARLRPKDKNDGTFWMPFDELISGSAGFVKLDFCDRTTKKDLNLKLKEDLGMFGIIFGCLKGLCRFMFCRGMWVIYCGSSSSGSTRSTKRGCDACIGCGDDVVEPKAVEIDIAHRAHSRMSANL